MLLLAIMVFLSAITVFFVTTSSSSPNPETISDKPESDNGGIVESIEISTPEGEGLLAQSIRGLIALKEDFNTGLTVVSGGTNATEENITSD